MAIAAVIAAGVTAWKADAIVDHVLNLRYGHTLPKARHPAARGAAEEHQQDLDYLAQLPTVDRSFTAASGAQFRARVAELRQRSASLTPAQFLMGVAAAVALADNAHTNLDAAAWRERLNSAPVRFAWFAEGLYIVRAMAPHAALLGARVLAIDGYDPAQLDRETGRYFGGTREHAHVASTLLLESPQALHELYPQAPDDRLVLSVEDGGAPRAIELPAVTSADAPAAARPGRLLSTAPLAGEKPGEWKTLLDPAREVPESLRDPEHLFYTARLGEGRVLYMHPWRISNGFDPGVGRAIDAAVGPASDPPWQRIVLDLRFNDGGEYPTVYRAIQALARRLDPAGRLVILTDNTTFSGAIITAALAKHFAGARATIVGERAGDRLAFWAEGNAIELPNSRIKVNTSTGYHDWARGCRELRCYWPNFYYDVAVGSIDPDIPAAWRFDDYRRGVDTVLTRALKDEPPRVARDRMPARRAARLPRA